VCLLLYHAIYLGAALAFSLFGFVKKLVTATTNLKLRAPSLKQSFCSAAIVMGEPMRQLKI